MSRLEGSALTLTVPDLEPITLAPSAYGGATAARGPDGARTWYVGGGTYNDDDTSTATLWSYDEATGEEATPVVLGPTAAPTGVLDVAVSPVDDAVYALSFQDHEDSPQTYGLSVVDDGQETYYPLTGAASRLAVSPDGGTLYLSENSGIYALDTAHLEADPEEDLDTRSAWIESDSSIQDLAIDPTGHLLAAVGNQVHSLGSPGTVSGFRYDTSADDPTYASISWLAPKATGGVSADNLSYLVTVTDRAGGQARTARSFSTDADFSDLLAGHTYDVRVIVDNGLFRGSAGTSSFTAPTAPKRLVHPKITGQAKVGKTLAAKAGLVDQPAPS